MNSYQKFEAMEKCFKQASYYISLALLLMAFGILSVVLLVVTGDEVFRYVGLWVSCTSIIFFILAFIFILLGKRNG